MTSRILAVLSVAVLLFSLVPGIDHGAWRPDEPRVLGTCVEMARTHDYIVPHLNGKPFLEKPPLYYAVAALSGQAFGVDKDIPYRFASLLFSLLTIILTFLMVSRREGMITGITAGGILASSWTFFMLSRWIQVDMALVFGVALAMYAYLRLMDTRRACDSILLGIAVGISFMVKGLVGPAIIGAAVITDIIRRRDLKILWKLGPNLIVPFAVLIVLPWVFALWSRGGWPFVREVIVVNNLMRFTGAAEAARLGHQQGPFYYLSSFPSGFLPWTLILIPAFISSVRKFREDPYINWIIGPFILLTAASTKRDIYLAPLFPAMAGMTAVWLNTAVRAKWEVWTVRITWGIAVLGAIAPFVWIFLGQPVLGLAMGIVSVFGLLAITRGGIRGREAVSLALTVCIVLFAAMTVYYPYETPRKDYFGFTRQTLAAIGERDFTLLAPDEALEGAVPMVTGRTCKEISKPSDIRDEGIYVWEDAKSNWILNELNAKHFRMEMLHEVTTSRNPHRTIRAAHIYPLKGAPAGTAGS